MQTAYREFANDVVLTSPFVSEFWTSGNLTAVHRNFRKLTESQGNFGKVLGKVLL